MAKFRVIEIGTYWKEFEVEATDRNNAITKTLMVMPIRESIECTQHEIENLTIKGKEIEERQKAKEK